MIVIDTIVIDTNVLVRYLTADDANQARAARQLVAEHAVRLTPTVLMETEWVLRSLYGFEQSHIHAALTAFAGLTGVSLDEPLRMAWAFGAFEGGMDLADAIHLSACQEDDSFTTFDRKLKAAATRLGADNVSLLQA